MTRRLRTLVAGRAAAVVIAAALAAGGGLALAGCGGGDDTDSTSTSGTAAQTAAASGEVVIADKGFTESQIVAQLYAQALEARGYTVTVKSLGSSQVADAAVRKGDIDMYPEYTGTALLTILEKPAATDSEAVFATVKTGYAARGLTALDQSPYNNDNRVACTKKAVDEYNLTTLSSLAPVAGKITYSANPEHVTRADGYPVLKSEYGITFGKVIPVALNQRYKPIADGQAQCVYAFGTDPQIADLGLVVLKDDKGTFQGTPYQNFPVVNSQFLSTAGPQLAETVNQVSALLDSQTMSALNAQVDLEGEDPEEVARQFLVDKGVISS